MLYIFILFLTWAMKQHAPLKEVFIRTQNPKKTPKSERFDDGCNCLLQKRTNAPNQYQILL